jgi:hypothetical protein
MVPVSDKIVRIVDNWYLLENQLIDGIYWSAGYLFEDRCQVVSTGMFTDAIDW